MAESSLVSSAGTLRRKIGRFLSVALIVAVMLATWGEAQRLMARNALRQRAAAESMLTVATVRPTRTDEGENLVLPGTVQAYIESPIYARTSGYLKSWYTDIGSTVRKGELLAEIDTPEVDQQLAQAVADLATARANEALSNTTDKRWRELLATESVSQQDADEKAGDAAAKRATAASAAANVSRLRELESFKRVLAPFDGVVTARNTDIGALINAGQSVGSELFRVADTRKLRIYVQVPEPYAGAAQPGVRAELKFSEQAGKSYTATTVRTSNALDPTLRTLQVELELDNARHEIFPGAYAEVHFKLPGNARSLRLPATTVLFRAPGPQVATVDSHNRIQLKSIVQGRDFGSSIEVMEGLVAGDQVVVNPPDSIINGVSVHVLSAAAGQQSKLAKTP
ncbi:MAG TPA: efflux RND transporter periplasmic adaptor subunit [Steroidobacteraceae bacterium]|jgi:RND family efflux transporter MFP subunit|nr:efflux RND transporter periplasmic adaptor subunit [Steroidobacteraceae bacterium]